MLLSGESPSRSKEVHNIALNPDIVKSRNFRALMSILTQLRWEMIHADEASEGATVCER